MTTVIAHATGQLEAPENSVAGMQKAKQLNSNLSWIEVDVRWNKSNFPFLLHDTTLDRTTNLSGSMMNYWFGDLMVCDAADFSPWNKKNSNGSWVYPDYHGIVSNGNGGQHARCHPPYGGEFFDAASDLGVNLLLDVKEVPTEAMADSLYEYIENFNYKNKVIYMASPASVQKMRGYYADLEYCIIEYPPTDMTREAESIKSYGAAGYALPFQRLTKEKVAYYKSSGLKMLTWTSDSTTIDVQTNWQKAVDWGVDFLITNKHIAAQQSL